MKGKTMTKALFEHSYKNKVYRAWKNMRERCTNPKSPRYSDYGGRGICIDPAWNKFETFAADMGTPLAWQSLERKDNNQGYSKANCIWASQSQQSLNQRLRKDNPFGVKGVTWHKRLNCFYANARHRGRLIHLYKGLDFFEACCKRKSWEIHERK
jgi:hypothetical protein